MSPIVLVPVASIGIESWESYGWLAKPLIVYASRVSLSPTSERYSHLTAPS